MKILSVANVVRGIVLLAIMTSGLVVKAQNEDSARINDLFNTVREHAVLAENDAELLDSYLRSHVSWETHSRKIATMKEHVNNLIADFNEAKTLRPEGSPWQQEAIDQIEPLLNGMAEHMNATINHLNANQSRVNMPPWRDYVRANRDYANRAAELIRDFVQYGEAKAKADSLEKKLELPPPTGQE